MAKEKGSELSVNHLSRQFVSLFQDGEVHVDEFKEAIKKNCTGKSYAEFPGPFKTFIANQFKTIDVNGTLMMTSLFIPSQFAKFVRKVIYPFHVHSKTSKLFS